MVGHVVSPFDLSQTLPIGGGLLVPCSSCRKTALSVVTLVPGQGGRFHSVCFP